MIRGKLIIHGEALNVETASIINPIIYLYGNDVHVKAVYSAGLMQLTDSGWVLDHAFRWQNDGQETDLGSIMLPTRLGALDLRQSGLAPQSISIYSLPGFIGSLEKAGIPTTNYLYYLYKTLSVPFLMIGIAMLAARFSLRHLSRGRSMWLFSRGALIASAILIFSYFMQIMGTSLQLPVRLAALAPAISILLIGAIALARTDESGYKQHDRLQLIQITISTVSAPMLIPNKQWKNLLESAMPIKPSQYWKMADGVDTGVRHFCRCNVMH